MEHQAIESSLLKYPGLIQEATKRLLATTETLEGLHVTVKEHVMRLNSIVAVNPALAKRMSWKTELDALLKADEAYQVAKLQDETASQQVALERIDLEYLHNMFAAYRSIAGMQGVR